MSRNPGPKTHLSRAALCAAVAVIALYAVGANFPHGAFWGFDGISYLPASWGIALLAAAVLIVIAYLLLPGAAIWSLEPVRRSRWMVWVGGAGVGALALFWLLPISTLAYGDARHFEAWNGANRSFDPTWWLRVVSPGLLVQKEALTVAVHRTLSYLLGLDILTTFRAVSAVSGALFVTLWILLSRQLTRDRPGFTLLALSGVLLGATQIFYGHVEYYAFAWLMWALFFGSAFLYFSDRCPLLLVLVLYLAAFRAHGLLIVTAPALVVPVAWSLRDRFPWIRHLLAWRGLLAFVTLPAMLAGLALYLVHFGSLRWSAWPPSSPENTFLPLHAPEPPMRDYGMLGWAHLADLANVAILTALPAWILITASFATSGFRVDWHHPRVKFASIAALFSTLFFAVVNPLLSMSRDWDLMAMGALPFLFFAAALVVHQHRPSARLAAWTPVVLVAGVLGFSNVLVNASSPLTSKRLEDLGTFVYAHYYGNASVLIQAGQQMEPNLRERLKRREAVLRDLAPNRRAHDPEYAFLLQTGGLLKLQVGDPEGAITWWEESTTYDPDADPLRLDLVSLYVKRHEYRKAVPHIRRLIERRPSDPGVIGLGAEVAIGLKDQELFDSLMNELGRLAPGHPELTRLSGLAEASGLHGWRQPQR